MCWQDIIQNDVQCTFPYRARPILVFCASLKDRPFSPTKVKSPSGIRSTSYKTGILYFWRQALFDFWLRICRGSQRFSRSRRRRRKPLATRSQQVRIGSRKLHTEIFYIACVDAYVTDNVLCPWIATLGDRDPFLQAEWEIGWEVEREGTGTGKGMDDGREGGREGERREEGGRNRDGVRQRQRQRQRQRGGNRQLQ